MTKDTEAETDETGLSLLPLYSWELGGEWDELLGAAHETNQQ